MKVLEVKTTTQIRDPNYPPNEAMTHKDRFTADNWGLELHPSGLGVYITGTNHTAFAAIAYARFESPKAEEPAKKGRK